MEEPPSTPALAVASSKPLLSLILPIMAGGVVVLLCLTLALMSLSRLHQSSQLVATREVPLSQATQKVMAAMEASQGALATAMEKDGADGVEDLSVQENILRKNTTTVNVLLAGMMWGTKTDTFTKADGGINIIEWQHLGLAEQLELEPVSEEQAHQLGFASINFAGFVNNARKALLAQEQSVVLAKVGRPADAAVARQEAQSWFTKQAPYAQAAVSHMNDFNIATNHDIAAYTAYSDTIFDANTKAIPLLALLAITGMLILGVIFMLRQVIRPVLALQKSFASIAAGDVGQVADVQASGPLGQFTQSFNSMVHNLSTELSTLRTTLQNKTEALEKGTHSYDQTKRAIINLLEDAKGLEEQLKLEKSNVEKKVVERTKELQQEQTRLAASVNSLPAGFIMTDNTQVVLINTNAKKLLLSGAKAASKNIDLAQIQASFKDALDFAGSIKKCLKTKKMIEVSELLFGTRFLHVYFTPIIDADGKAIGVVVLVQDVTEEKVMQRSKDEFFSIASHELRTPLTAIRGNTSMIQQYYPEAMKDPDLKDMVSDIHGSSVRLIEIVNDFLDASRLEQGKVEFKKQVFNIDKTIESVVYEMAGVSKEKGIYIRTGNTLDSLPEVCADRDKVKQIVYNLVGNAMKFTDKGGITITPIVDKDHLRVQIIDTGRGIAADQQSLLFHKFQQATSSLFTRDTTRGTGLGLYISKLLAENMGGKVSLDKSEQGKGSVFSFTVPLATAADKKNAAKAT